MRITLLPWIAAITALVVAGCATSPPLPRIEAARGDRVGILVDGDDDLSHTHIGTTVFNNFNKKYPFAWHMNGEVTRTIEQRVRDAGFTPVNLRDERIQYADVAGLVQPTSDQWKVAAGKDEAFRSLRDRLRLKALIVLKEASVLVGKKCYDSPCEERYVHASGLYTRSAFGLTAYYAVAAYQWNVFVLDPIADTASADPLKSVLMDSATRAPRLKDTTDFHQLTEAELLPVRDAILHIVEKNAVEAVKTLNPK